MAQPIEYYSLLGVAPGAGADDIRAAFRAAARAWHSDRWCGAPGWQQAHAEEMMKRVNVARDTLTDPARRAAYDRAREAQMKADKAGRSQSTGWAEDADQLSLACPHCGNQQRLASPVGDLVGFTCRECAQKLVALVGVVCRSCRWRPVADRSYQFEVAIELANGREQLVTFVSQHRVTLRDRDSFSIVYADSVPAAVVNHTRRSSWPLWQKQSAPTAAVPDYLGICVGIACWLAAFFVARPWIGNVPYLAAILVATPILASRKQRRVGRWLAGAACSAGAAMFVLAYMRPATRDPRTTQRAAATA
ncbi:MAG: DnaJ domain-containing protein [Solirubrobacteraceae bacterium]